MRLPVKITRRNFLIGWFLWTIWIFIFAIVLMIGAELTFFIALLSAAQSYYPMAIYSIFVLAFCRKYRLEHHHIVTFIIVHFGVAIFFSLFWQTIDYSLGWLLWREAVFYYKPIRGVGIYMVYNGMLIYALLAGIFYSSDLFRRYREKELKEAQLQSLNREAEVRALKSQINPHFLFNTLNTIFALIGGDTQKAKSTVTRLSDLLRYSLSGFNQDFVPLTKELDAVKTYLAIEKERFGARLQVEFHVDAQLAAYEVPPMILQPIVENAVKHGISTSKEPGLIEIRIHRNESFMEIEVKNTGKKLANCMVYSENNNGIGLKNLRQRLSRIYEQQAELITEPQENGGFITKVIIFKSNIEHPTLNTESGKV